MTNQNATEPGLTSELAAKALRGNRLAGEALLSRNRPFVYSLCLRSLRDIDDAQDVTQEVLVYLMQNLNNLREPEKIPGWLRKVCLNHCVDFRRRRSTRHLGQSLEVINEVSTNSNFAERIVLKDSLASLSSDHRTTVLLHYVGGWSQDEIADLMDTSINTVRSRLMAAKKILRNELLNGDEPSKAKGKQMTKNTFGLGNDTLELLFEAYPDSTIVSVRTEPEAWQPFRNVIEIKDRNNQTKMLATRNDIDPPRAAILSCLRTAGLPCPEILAPLKADGHSYLSLVNGPSGVNLPEWTLGGTPHRIKIATERTFEAIDTLANLTLTLKASPCAYQIPTRTLQDELCILEDDDLWKSDAWLAEEGLHRREWLNDTWFRESLEWVKDKVTDCSEPLVYTNYLFFFSGSYRVAASAMSDDHPMGWPGDPNLNRNPLAEFTSPFGHFGDPYLGLSMVWIYDCYPFVHTGFVEQYLWRHGITQRQFAPRLALKALQMIARDLPHERPQEGGSYWDGMKGWVELAKSWCVVRI